MNFRKIIKILKQNNMQYGVNESFKDYCTYRIGGKIRLIIFVSTIEELMIVLDNIDFSDLFIIGNGSKILPPDKTFNKVVIKLMGEFEQIELNGETLIVGAGANISKAINFCKANKLHGLEFMSGIPASCGGAVFMNAGAHGCELKKIVNSVHCFCDDFLETKSESISTRNEGIKTKQEIIGELHEDFKQNKRDRIGQENDNGTKDWKQNKNNQIGQEKIIRNKINVKQNKNYQQAKLKNKFYEKVLKNSECQFGYRTSVFHNLKCVITKIEFNLQQMQDTQVSENCNIYLKLRQAQPCGKSCGSVFKKVDNISAGKLIDECGLKGLMCGDAIISDKHANFFVNTKKAKAKNIKYLIDKATKEVYNKYNKTLEKEVIILE